MSEREIKIGDVVALKSEDPWMTVNDIDSRHKTLHCVWFFEIELHTGSFAVKAVKLKPTQEDKDAAAAAEAAKVSL